MDIGDIRIREFTHPDSINVTVWEVDKLTICDGKYAKPGATYWKRMTPGIEPFTDKIEAVLFMDSLKNNPASEPAGLGNKAQRFNEGPGKS